jgi:hypothetical protein
MAGDVAHGDWIVRCDGVEVGNREVAVVLDQRIIVRAATDRLAGRGLGYSLGNTSLNVGDGAVGRRPAIDRSGVSECCHEGMSVCLDEAGYERTASCIDRDHSGDGDSVDFRVAADGDDASSHDGNSGGRRTTLIKGDDVGIANGQLHVIPSDTLQRSVSHSVAQRDSLRVQPVSKGDD